ncbi:barstar family protein [Myceligenerans crystallogenes]|uniref:Barstar (barnase inhibitor) domain-containing protein n=1 Tax=Myceligenerans crystallogenes TaxID=316335 RepID=A0ABP4ZF02_9MICO
MTGTAGVFQLVDDVRDSLAGRVILRPGVTSVALLDAMRLTTEYEVLEALNDQFRFPAYFGWNWDAVHDCLGDLSWIPADRYVVAIENSGRLDLAAGHPHRLLIRALRRAAWALSPDNPGGRRPPAEFAVLLLRRSEDARGLVSRFHAIGEVLDDFILAEDLGGIVAQHDSELTGDLLACLDDIGTKQLRVTCPSPDWGETLSDIYAIRGSLGAVVHGVEATVAAMSSHDGTVGVVSLAVGDSLFLVVLDASLTKLIGTIRSSISGVDP